MIPIGSSSSRTKGRLVMERAFPVVGYCVAGQNPCRTPHPATPYPTTGNGKGRVGLGSLRHAYGRVQLTLRLRRREAGAGLAPPTADDLPTAVLGLQGRGGERGRADHDGEVAGLEAAHRAHERAVRFEAPMRRGALSCAQRAMLLTPARERRESQAPGDDAVDVLEQQHLGEEVLPRGAR